MEPKKRAKRDRCFCSGYWFVHRKGSKWCYEYKGKLTDKDYESRGMGVSI